MSTLKDLLAQKRAIEKQIAAAKTAGAKDADISKIKKMMEECGVTISDLRKSSGNKPPKYVDPTTGKTWSGYGRPPAWIAGLKREEVGQPVEA